MQHTTTSSTRSRFIKFSLFVWFLWSSSLFAQAKFLINLDAAQFQDSENNPYFELYYSIPGTAVHYMADEKQGYTYELIANLQIYQIDSLWVSKLWKITESIADTSHHQKSFIVDVLRFPVEKSGDYRVLLKVRDLHVPQHEDSAVVNLKLYIPLKNAIGLSDVEFASKIDKAGAESSDKFKKYSYEIIPNPMGVYGVNSPDLYFYYEGYDILNHIPGKKYKLLSMVKQYNGGVVENITIPYRIKVKRFERSVEFGKLDVTTLPSGKYTFMYGICDSAQNLLIGKQKDFYIYNPSVAISPLKNTANPTEHGLEVLEGMSSIELDVEFEKMFYLTNKNQRNLYNNLTEPTAKRQIIHSIWLASAADANTTWYKFRQDYLERVDIAADKFHSPSKSGWKTEQGRVYVLYGPPSNIERNPSAIDKKPYQTWYYDELEGGVYFIFVDRSGLNRYELVHSNKRGELQNPDWQRLISTTLERY